jgi:hypothetical protein
MPCSCQLPPEIYPDAADWGPLLWTILHGMAEKVGTTPFPMYYNDERRALVKFYQAVAKMIPCPSCKEHYEVYLKEHPVDKAFLELPYEEIGPYARGWFWELHNWVNESHKKPLLPLEDVSALYKGADLRLTLKKFNAPMTKAIRIRGQQLLCYNEFVKWFTMLCAIYGC